MADARVVIDDMNARIVTKLALQIDAKKAGVRAQRAAIDNPAASAPRFARCTPSPGPYSGDHAPRSKSILSATRPTNAFPASIEACRKRRWRTLADKMDSPRAVAVRPR